MTKHDYLKIFFKKHDLRDIKKHIKGELNEYSTEEATFYFGNSELIISPADESEDEIVLSLDQIGFYPMLTE